MITKKTLVKTIIILFIFSAIFVLGYNKVYLNRENSKGQTFVIAGLEKNQTGIVQELAKSSAEYSFVKKGHEYFKSGEIDKAIEQYCIVLERDKGTGSTISAVRGLIDAYEKKKDYKESYELLARLVSNYKIPPMDKFRVPDEERLKYLEYAFNGEYELAISHAKLAMDANAALPTSLTELYLERLNDLKASKEYIESLRRQKREI